MTSSTRHIIQVFEEYQRARVKFVQLVAELAKNPLSVKSLQAAGVMSLLRPLLLDNVPSIQHSAALALGRLAGYSEELAKSVVAAEILPQLVYSLAEQNRFYKKSAALVLRSVAKHSPALAQAVVDCGAADALVGCLAEFDPAVKEAAAWALGYVARHSGELAQAVVDAGGVALLVSCLPEPELELKRVAASSIAEVAKHSAELAQVVVDAGAIQQLAPLIGCEDGKVQRYACSALAQIGKHAVEHAELVVEADVIPAVFPLLHDPDEATRRAACTLIREVAQHTPELSQLIVNAGGLGPLVEFCASSTAAAAQLPGAMTLGFIGGFSDTLALAVICARGVHALAELLTPDKEPFVRSAAAWAVGMIGRHSADHAKGVAECRVLPRLLDIFVSESSPPELRSKAKTALKVIASRCVHLPALQPLLQETTPKSILKVILAQFVKVLPVDISAKRAFVKSRGLALVQRIEAEPGSVLAECIEGINACYPPEMVQFYSPDYEETFLEKLDHYTHSGQ